MSDGERRGAAWIAWNADVSWDVVEAAARVVGTTTTPREYFDNGTFLGPGEDFSAASGVAHSAPVNPADAATGKFGTYTGYVERPGNGLEQMPESSDIHEVLAWARARADVIWVSPSWDSARHYWGGERPSPRPRDLPDLVIPDDAPGSAIPALGGEELESGLREFVERQRRPET